MMSLIYQIVVAENVNCKFTIIFFINGKWG